MGSGFYGTFNRFCYSYQSCNYNLTMLNAAHKGIEENVACDYVSPTLSLSLFLSLNLLALCLGFFLCG